jgi:hypothetical protein
LLLSDISARIAAYSPIDMSNILSDNSRNEEINRHESTEEYMNEDIQLNDSREESVSHFRLFENSFSQTKEMSNISMDSESSCGIEPMHSMMLHMSEVTDVSPRPVQRNRKRGNET